MNKTELIKEIAVQTGMSQSKLETVLDLFTDTIISAIVNGEDVRIANFGSFTKKQRKARVGRNPQTGEAVEVPSRWAPKFRPSDRFKELTNQ